MKAERIALKVLSVFTMLSGLAAVLMAVLFFFDLTREFADNMPGQLYEYGMRLSVSDAGGFYRVYGLFSGLCQFFAGFFGLRFSSVHVDLEGDAEASRKRSARWAFILTAFVLSDALVETVLAFMREKPTGFEVVTLVMAPLIAFVFFALIISRRARIKVS